MLIWSILAVPALSNGQKPQDPPPNPLEMEKISDNVDELTDYLSIIQQ